MTTNPTDAEDQTDPEAADPADAEETAGPTDDGTSAEDADERPVADAVDAPDEAPDGAVADRVGGEAGGTVGLDEDRDEDDDEGPSRLLLVVGAAVAFVAIAIVGVLIASGGDSGGGGGDGQQESATDARTDVGIFGTIDQFDRPDDPGSMGDFAPGRPWTEGAGTWGIIDGEAYLSRSAEFRNHSVIGIGQGDGGAQVRLDKVVNGAGLVFRYVGPYNYWAVVAVPDVATWNVIKVVDGDQEVVGNTGQSPTADGTTVGVRMEGDTIDVIINGRIRKTIVDDFQAEAGKVGVTARGPDSGDARFDDFVAGLPGGNPIVRAGGNGVGANGAGADGAGGSSTTTAAP
ncbi:MAG TPA: hypothetical protein PKA98_13575 [Acidimicrobiales bacterium]|nr:hypothetical protein [Acidimicrobiales bacterium]